MAQTILDTYRWQHRLVLLFAPTADDADYLRQLQLFADAKAGFGERDIVTLEIVAEAAASGDRTFKTHEAAALRQTYNAPSDGFLLILVGKDGGVKRRSNDPVEANDLFSQIDAMPMRQREMRSP